MSEKHLGVDVGRVDLSQKCEPGFEILKTDGRRYRYTKASGAIALGDALMADYADSTWSAKQSNAAAVPIIGCWPNENPAAGTARAAISSASTTFFWMLVKGDALVKFTGAGTVGAAAEASATAGTLKDNAAAAADAVALAAGPAMVSVTVQAGGFSRVMFG